MLAKKYRFSYTKGAPNRSITSPLFRIAYNIRNADGLRLAVVVSKKVDKRAVERNRIKRMITDIIEQLVSKSTNADLVFFVKKTIQERDKESVSEEIKAAISQINF